MDALIGSVGPLLAGMVAKGLVTLAQLDQAPPRWLAEVPLMTEMRRMQGKPAPVWSNPAREWIDANPREWVALQNLHADARAARQQYRRSASGLGWPEAAAEKLPAVAPGGSRGWADSDDLVEFEP